MLSVIGYHGPVDTYKIFLPLKMVFTKLSRKERDTACKRYFKTLAGNYKQQINPEVAVKYAARSKANTRGKRVDRVRLLLNLERIGLRFFSGQMVEDIRSFVLPIVAKLLADKFGPENCLGLADVIRATWMDPIHSDAGDAGKEVWEARKMAMGGGGEGTSAWEARRRLWKSRTVSL